VQLWFLTVLLLYSATYKKKQWFQSAILDLFLSDIQKLEDAGLISFPGMALEGQQAGLTCENECGNALKSAKQHLYYALGPALPGISWLPPKDAGLQ